MLAFLQYTTIRDHHIDLIPPCAGMTTVSVEVQTLPLSRDSYSSKSPLLLVNATKRNPKNKTPSS